MIKASEAVEFAKTVFGVDEKFVVFRAALVESAYSRRQSLKTAVEW